MTDLALSALLGEAIHGAPPPPVEAITAACADRGLVCPGALVAAQGEAEPATVPGRALAIHPGLRYWWGTDGRALEDALTDAGIVHGPAQAITSPAGLIHAIQRAIVTMREVALARSREHLGEDPGFAAERDLLAVVVQHLRENDAAWADAARVWTDLVLWRHRGNLNTIRRKLLEACTACTRDCDRSTALGSALRVTTLRLAETFDLQALQEVALDAFDHLRMALAQDAPPRQARSPALRAALAWIEANVLDPISLSDVAAAVDVSPTHLAHACRRELGCTILERIQALRIDHAKDLLVHGSDSILAIALASGFPSVEHFHRCFKRATGTTPRRWRLQAR